MTPVIPITLHVGAELVLIAESQDNYVMLPASVSPDGLVMSEWVLTAVEMLHLMSGGRVRLWQHTGGLPMQPINVEVAPPVETATVHVTGMRRFNARCVVGMWLLRLAAWIFPFKTNVEVKR